MASSDVSCKRAPVSREQPGRSRSLVPRSSESLDTPRVSWRNLPQASNPNDRPSNGNPEGCVYTTGYTNRFIVPNLASTAGSRPPTLCSRGIQTALNARAASMSYRFKTAGSRTANAFELPEMSIGHSPSTQNCTMRPFG